VALAESCITGNFGAEIHLGNRPERWDELLFAEGGARILVSVHSEKISPWESYLTEKLADNWQKLGTVGAVGGDLRIFTDVNQPLIQLSIKQMSDRWYRAIERRMAG
jgi:phosphoribosylformylglycinamidine synthase